MPQRSVGPTDYPEVNSVLRELLSGAQRTLGDHFVGMYLDGSLAIGDFDLDKSDIDFVVVTDAEVSEDTFGVLKTMHDRFAGGASKWGRELEGSYISQRALRYDRRPAAHPYIDRGSVLAMVQQETGYWPIHRHMLREHGVVLAGPPPPVLIDPVAPEDLREAVRGILREWWTPMLTEGPRLQNGFYRCYAVLTMSRMLYTLRHGTIVTKPFAAQWGQGPADPFDLQRFVEAQKGTYAQALAELRAGRKQTHWIWFVLPQVSGLGTSGMSMRYGIKSLEEARAYLAHQLLGARLRECISTLIALPHSDAAAVLGTLDAVKFRSCLTLFAAADAKEPLFTAALSKYFRGTPDEATLSILAAGDTA